MSYAQITVQGTVVDADGSILIGATILEKGTSHGTITDVDGKYSVEVTDKNSVPIFSYTGYRTQAVQAVGGSLDVTLFFDAIGLEDIVVVGYSPQKRKDIAGSVSSVDISELEDIPMPSMQTALQGRAAGVMVTQNSRTPGGGIDVRIRGSTSINASNQPLYIVDGIPIIDDNVDFTQVGVGNAQLSLLADLNPNDIASVTVLKGASAKALYGVRAANGAIVITTQKGEIGKPVINISTTYGRDDVNKLPERQSIYSQGRTRNGVSTYRGPSTGEGDSWGPLLTDLEFDGATDYFFDTKGALVPTGQGNGQPAVAYDPYTFFITGETVDVNASISGGTDALRYFISGGRLDQTGIVPNADFTRTSFRTNLEAQFTDKLTASISANFVNSSGSRIQRGSNLQGVMLGLLRNAVTFDIGNGKIGQAAADDPTTYVNPDGSQRSYRWGIYDSPYWTANKNPFNDDVNRIIGYGSLKYDINDWLFASYKLGIDRYSERTLGAEDINLGGFGGNSGEVNQTFAGNTDLNSDYIIGVNKQLTDVFTISGLVGYNMFNTHYTQQATFGET